MITGDFAVFADQHRFQDDVWGQIILNDLERRVIDTPEFQRLFRTSQLGFVDLVYQSANHTRGAHSIGTCHISNRLMNSLTDNMKRLGGGRAQHALIKISEAERVVIRLGALLHDISHVPLSHDLERKTHRVPYQPELKLRSCYGHYDKHDD
ncbi:MAG: HD domain-containing protein [Gemmataceae bacterium]